MNRRRFFESLFKLGGTTIAAPIIAKTIDPSIFDKLGRWIKRLMAPPIRKIGDFSKFMFPIIRGIVPEFCVKDFILIQPMNAPITSILDLKCQEKSISELETVPPKPVDTSSELYYKDWCGA